MLFWTFDFERKKVRRFFGYRSSKKNQNFQKILKKTLYKRVTLKRYNFASGAANPTFFFNSPCIVPFSTRYSFIWRQSLTKFWFYFLIQHVLQFHEKVRNLTILLTINIYIYNITLKTIISEASQFSYISIYISNYLAV